MTVASEVRSGSTWLAIGMLLALLGFQSCEIAGLTARVEALEATP